MRDPKCRGCVLVVGDRPDQTVAEAQRQFRATVAEEEKDYVFSADYFNIQSIGGQFIVELWYHRIPRLP
jgi:hypothetical protein